MILTFVYLCSEDTNSPERKHRKIDLNHNLHPASTTTDPSTSASNQTANTYVRIYMAMKDAVEGFNVIQQCDFFYSEMQTNHREREEERSLAEIYLIFCIFNVFIVSDFIRLFCIMASLGLVLLF